MKIARGIAMIAPVLLAATPLLGQESEIAEAPEGNRWLPIIVCFVLVLAVLIASFMSSRRGHQD